MMKIKKLPLYLRTNYNCENNIDGSVELLKHIEEMQEIKSHLMDLVIGIDKIQASFDDTFKLSENVDKEIVKVLQDLDPAQTAKLLEDYPEYKTMMNQMDQEEARPEDLRED